jgi:murein DD-endopeptidase MepM/ murein hydrolase activator NlpD
VSIKLQLAAGAGVVALSAWGAVASASYLGSRQSLVDATRTIDALEQAYGDLLAQSQRSTASFTEQLAALEATDQRQQAELGELGRIREMLFRQLEGRARQLDDVTEQRNQARSRIGELERTLAEVKAGMQGALADSAALNGQLESAQQRIAAVSWEREHAWNRIDNLERALAGIKAGMQGTLTDNAALNAQLAGAEERIAAVSRQRAAARQAEIGLRWQLARLEAEIKQLRSRREMAQLWLKDWVSGSTEALERLFVETGVDVEQLLERVSPPELGQGGPLQLAAVEPSGAHATALPADPIGTDIQRLAALQRLTRVLPLGAPLDHFDLASPFGKRRDPFTKGWAYHAGLDFHAAAGSAALATAPGTVTQAGANGPYGNMVEIDHGMGVVTRYAHLKKVSVAPGDQVKHRQPIGIIGSSGRSTGIHLHYEVRIDDVAYDPVRFLEAGRLLVGIFAGAGGTEGAASDGG